MAMREWPATLLAHGKRNGEDVTLKMILSGRCTDHVMKRAKEHLMANGDGFVFKRFSKFNWFPAGTPPTNEIVVEPQQ